MQFKTAAEVESLCYQMKLADYPRSRNRARINELFNGHPPYTEQEVEENNIAVNVNDLASTRVSHDARTQFYSAFMKPGNYFKATTDMGPKHRRSTYSTTFTKEITRIMKRSLPYFEAFRSKIASCVLHGIGPNAWRDADAWCPDPMGVEDIFVPANTLLTMRNLPFFAIYRQFTAPELIRLTRGPNVDPGWQMGVVNSCIDFIDKESQALLGTNWPEAWSPEKMQERTKGDGGFYVGDSVPTINVFDFYFWNDDKKSSGWSRRMIIDAWSSPEGEKMTRDSRVEFSRGNFLYDSGSRKFADAREQLVSFQFADLSSVAPFRYHTVRSLGFLLYAVCHLQNRLRCKTNEAVFETMMMMFQVKSMDEGQRALKLMMANQGLIDETLRPIPASERWQVNTDLVQFGLAENTRLIEQNSSSYTQNQDFSRDRTEKTKFQVMAEVNAITSLVSASLMQAYQYQNFEYYEIVRRFCKKNSRDPEVRTFRANCLRQGIPEKLLVPEAWDVEPERVMGAGNKTLEMAIAEQLMQFRHLYDPEPQRDILRDFTLAVTDDPARAMMMVPEQPVRVSDSVHDAQLAAGVLMQSLPVAIKTGMNHVEYVETLMASMALVIKRANANGQMASMEEVAGLNNMAQHIQAHIDIIAQDPKEQQRVKVYGDRLSRMMNLVKAFAQRLQEQMEAQQQNGNGQMDPEAMAKIEAQNMQAEAKNANTRESHAQRTAQRQIQFEAEEKRAEEEHKLEMQREREKLEMEKEKMRMELEMEREKMQMEMQLEREKAQLQMQVEREKAEAQKEAAKAQAKQQVNKPKPKSE